MLSTCHTSICLPMNIRKEVTRMHTQIMLNTEPMEYWKQGSYQTLNLKIGEEVAKDCGPQVYTMALTLDRGEPLTLLSLYSKRLYSNIQLRGWVRYQVWCSPWTCIGSGSPPRPPPRPAPPPCCWTRPGGPLTSSPTTCNKHPVNTHCCPVLLQTSLTQSLWTGIYNLNPGAAETLLNTHEDIKVFCLICHFSAIFCLVPFWNLPAMANSCAAAKALLPPLT